MAYVKCIRNLISSTVPDGKTVTPTDDISIWLACGGRSETYTTLSQVLSDVACLSSLINDNNAVDYLVRSTTWASDVCGDSSAMSYIGLNNYASNTLLADSTWCSAICNSAYFESVLNVKVPVMTDNTHPSGVCSASSNNADAYRAFDGITTYSYIPDSNATNNHVRYTFPDEVNIFMMKALIRRQNNQARELKYQYSANGDTYSDVEAFNVPAGTTNYEHTVIAPLTGVGFGLFCADTMYVSGSWILGVWELQFYGRADI